MQCQGVDRVLRAVALVVQLEERFPFPRNLSTPHPIVLIKQAEQQSVATRCMVCGADDVPLERHHIAGRPNFRDTISVCKRCHDELTNIYQPKWLPWRNAERDPLECYFLGWSDIFHLIWQRTRRRYFLELSKTFALNARYAR
jgi:hypothetical protein